MGGGTYPCVFRRHRISVRSWSEEHAFAAQPRFETALSYKQRAQATTLLLGGVATRSVTYCWSGVGARRVVSRAIVAHGVVW